MKRFIKHWLGLDAIEDAMRLLRSMIQVEVDTKAQGWKNEAKEKLLSIEKDLIEKYGKINADLAAYISFNNDENARAREDHRKHSLEIERGLRALEETNRAIQKILEGKE